MKTQLDKILDDAIERLSNVQASAGCNDYMMPDTPENRLLFEQYGAWNCNLDLDAYRASDDYRDPSGHTRNGALCIGDGIMIYAMALAQEALNEMEGV